MVDLHCVGRQRGRGVSKAKQKKTFHHISCTCKVSGLGMRLQCQGVRLQCLGVRLQCLGARMQCLGARLQCLGVRLQCCEQSSTYRFQCHLILFAWGHLHQCLWMSKYVTCHCRFAPGKSSESTSMHKQILQSKKLCSTSRPAFLFRKCNCSRIN